MSYHEVVHELIPAATRTIIMCPTVQVVGRAQALDELQLSHKALVIGRWLQRWTTHAQRAPWLPSEIGMSRALKTKLCV